MVVENTPRILDERAMWAICLRVLFTSGWNSESVFQGLVQSQSVGGLFERLREDNRADMIMMCLMRRFWGCYFPLVHSMALSERLSGVSLLKLWIPLHLSIESSHTSDLRSQSVLAFALVISIGRCPSRASCVWFLTLIVFEFMQLWFATIESIAFLSVCLSVSLLTCLLPV